MNPSAGADRSRAQDSGRDVLVAICLPTFDPPPELFRRQVESIREQTHRKWICLISDDRSSKDAFAMIEEAVGDDDRFRIRRNEERLGIYANVERVLGSVPAEAGLVALADQDDRWQPEKLVTLAGRLAGEVNLAYSDARVTRPDGEVVSPTFWTSRRNNSDDLGALLIANSITGAASLFRRELLDLTLPFPPPQLGLMHDHWLAMVAMSLGEVAYVDNALYDYVQHPGAALGHEESRARQARGTYARRGYASIRSIEAAAGELLRRGGDSIPAQKRRVISRCARIERSPDAWLWLARLWATSLLRGSKTRRAERFLLAGVAWGATHPGSKLGLDADGPDAYPLDWRARSKLRRRLRRTLIGRAVGCIADLGLNARQRAIGIGRELDELAAEGPRREVLVLGIYGGDGGQMEAALRRIRESVHNVRVVLGAMGEAGPALAEETVLTEMAGGKFANLNRVAETAGPLAADWVLILDDDISVGRHFLDRLLVVAERFHLTLAQPALSRASYGWWNVNRRRAALVRETRFVEIGPAILMRREAYRALIPFPEEGMGWGLDLSWAAFALSRGWRMGVVDAVPARHESHRTAIDVDIDQSREAAERLLEQTDHLTYVEAESVLARHTRIR